MASEIANLGNYSPEDVVMIIQLECRKSYCKWYGGWNIHLL